MTPTELRDILASLPGGWSQAMGAEAAGRDNSLFRKMCRGARPIDDELAAWFRRLQELAGRLPASRDEWQAHLDNPPLRVPYKGHMGDGSSRTTDEASC